MKLLKLTLISLIIGASLSCNSKPAKPNDGTNTLKNDKVTLPAGYVDGSNSDNIIPPTDTLNLTTIAWIDTLKDLGNLKKGGLVEVVYRFKNTGTKPLSINSVIAGCGCTQPIRPVKQFAPGEAGTISAKFNTENQNGKVEKHITVTTNSNPATKVLDFKAVVE